MKLSNIQFKILIDNRFFIETGTNVANFQLPVNILSTITSIVDFHELFRLGPKVELTPYPKSLLIAKRYCPKKAEGGKSHQDTTTYRVK